ncbi:MAG: Flagellar basal-body rod protein FlgG [Phycisphaerales bacterium]|nr:Flagellar basal-body rod protein FlgG [Phycisphaerales bacterium]
MLYGLYLSAAGVQTNSYRQDVIANNIANAETVGFKRDLALFQQRRTEVQEKGLSPFRSNALLEKLGGGVFASPTLIDHTQGELENTGNGLDVAIVGQGYLQAAHGDQTSLTRDGRILINHKGHLALANNENFELMDPKGKPIAVDPSIAPNIDKEGVVTQKGKVVGRISVVDVADPSLLTKSGGTMLAIADPKQIRPATGAFLQSGYQERANVEPSTELASLMDAQRQLEANANMIRYQDQMLSKLCNEVGKIS